MRLISYRNCQLTLIVLCTLASFQPHISLANETSFENNTPINNSDPRKIFLGSVNGISVTLIKGISHGGVAYYILNGTDQSDSVYEINHQKLNAIFNNGMPTDDTKRQIEINGFRIALLNTQEIADLRRTFSFKDPVGWNISGRNIASATYTPAGHHNVSFNSEGIFTDGGGVYGGVAIVRIVLAPPGFRMPSAASGNMATPPSNSSRPPANVSKPQASSPVDKLGRAADALGPAGWARCVAANTMVAALIARGDPVPPVIVKEHKSIGPVLSSLRGRMLARYPSHTLDKLVQGNSIQIRNASDPFIAAFSVVDECTGSIASAMK